MAFFKGEVHSSALSMDTSINVIMPQDLILSSTAAQDAGIEVAGPCKVLYLLHGLTDGSCAWSRFTSIERYARQLGIAVVMPEVHHSFYTDMKYGMNYFTYVADELPKLVASMFNISLKREDSYIAGLSMGGYGALKIGLSRPDKFCAAAGFSSAIDIERRINEGIWNNEQLKREMVAIFDGVCKEEDNLFWLAENAAKKYPDSLPKVYMACGLGDELLNENHMLRDLISTLPYNFKYEEWEGKHEWAFWDVAVQKALGFFFEK